MPQLLFKQKRWAEYEARKLTRLRRPHKAVRTASGNWTLVMVTKTRGSR